MEKKDMKETLYMLGLDKDTKKVVLPQIRNHPQKMI